MTYVGAVRELNGAAEMAITYLRDGVRAVHVLHVHVSVLLSSTIWQLSVIARHVRGSASLAVLRA